MAKYNVPTNGIIRRVLYQVVGTQSVIYNSVTYTTGQTFRGISGISTFTYSGGGTQEVNAIPELWGAGIEYIQDDTDLPANFFTEDQTNLKGFSVEYVQSDADIAVTETTAIAGFSIEYVDSNSQVTSVHKRYVKRNTDRLRDRFQPVTGVLKLSPSQSGGLTTGVDEASAIADEGDIKIYFSRHNGISGSDNVICMANTVNMEDDWIVNATPVVGMGYGGAPANRQANCSHVFRAGIYIYCVATNGYGFGAVGEDRNVYMYRSTDGVNFTDLGKILDKSIIPGGTIGFGNSHLEPTLVGGVYNFMIEATDATGIWKVYRLTSTNIESGWTYANAVPTLETVTSSTYGGQQVIRHNNLWYVFYHYGNNPSINLPSYVAFATSPDLVTFRIKETPLFGIEAKPFGVNTDQIADPFVFEANGKTYLLAEYTKNYPTYEAQLWMWTFNGTLIELFDGI